ncbi:MAG: S1-like domain-containing RNA-binding protein [Lachnospiraceae bacterium]|nr:S1-like domain-containing RNA-binding protein [Lachnospiraceae bacterium]
MIELGKKQELVIVRKVDFGVYLGETVEAGETERVLLPIKQVPEGAQVGDAVTVFIYKDSSDRIIATVNEPKLQVGEFTTLKVLEVGEIGAFLDWGLEKDLLLPFSEQTKKVHEGEEVLAALYVDKSERLCGTMRVYKYLKTKSPYQMGDMVEGLIYELNEDFGVFVAVDRMYSGLIPKKEAQGDYKVGQTLQLRVTEVKEDGKLNLSAKQKAYIQMNEDAEMVLAAITEDYDGVLPFDDKAAPEVIQREFGLSKNAFKRAVGHLYKEKLIEIKDGKIIKTQA